MLHSILLPYCYHMILLFPPLINTEQCDNVLMVVVCSYSTMGSCSSGGRVGRPLIIRVAAHSLSLFVHMTKCPWARHFNPNYSHYVDVVKYVLDKSVKQKQTKKKKTQPEVTWKQQNADDTQEVKDRRGHRPGFGKAFVLQDGLVTFQSAICGDVLSVCIDVREPTGGVPSPCAHLPLLLQSAVPCGAPDVAYRIIHTCTLMKVSIWSHALKLSPRTHTGVGTLLLWHLTDSRAWDTAVLLLFCL